jgi:hypothetical protein
VKIAVLGCGPTGLAAAQACSQAGHRVDIHSRMCKSSLYGAQYLHEPIPGLEYEPPVKVAYLLAGSIDGYREKVYGSLKDYRSAIRVSPEDYEGEHEAWDIRAAYDQLWEKFFNSIKNVVSIDPIYVRGLLTCYDLVINTIHKTQLCEIPDHLFDSQPIWAMGDAPGIQMIPVSCPENTVLCSGQRRDEWYRVSNVYGYRTAEWPYRRSGKRPTLNGRPLPAARVNKPTFNTCDCFPSVLHVGRFGKWAKGQLVSHAYAEVVKCLSS